MRKKPYDLVARMRERGSKCERYVGPADAWCGFCGKHRSECKKLIDGPVTNVCDECVELFNDILAEDQP